MAEIHLKSRLDITSISSTWMKSRDFVAIIDSLLERGLIRPELTFVSLFNWGEPSLNPEIGSILDILCDLGFHYNISTNGSKIINFTRRQSRFLNILLPMTRYMALTF